MKYQFGDNVTDPKSRAAKIRSLFISGMTINAHTEFCIDQKLWSETRMRGRAFRGCREVARRVRKTKADYRENGERAI